MKALAIIEGAFADEEDDSRRNEPLNKRFKWKPPGERAATPAPVSPADVSPPAEPDGDSPDSGKFLSHRDALASAGMDRELNMDDVLDLSNKARLMKARDRKRLRPQIHRMGMGIQPKFRVPGLESLARKTVDQLLDE